MKFTRIEWENISQRRLVQTWMMVMWEWRRWEWIGGTCHTFNIWLWESALSPTFCWYYIQESRSRKGIKSVWLRHWEDVDKIRSSSEKLLFLTWSCFLCGLPRAVIENRELSVKGSGKIEIWYFEELSPRTFSLTDNSDPVIEILWLVIGTTWFNFCYLKNEITIPVDFLKNCAPDDDVKCFLTHFRCIVITCLTHTSSLTHHL